MMYMYNKNIIIKTIFSLIEKFHGKKYGTDKARIYRYEIYRSELYQSSIYVNVFYLIQRRYSVKIH